MNARLISVEGISGVGKTTLTRPFVDLLRAQGRLVLSLDSFSERAASPGHDLGRDILRALIGAAGGDPFLRGGHPCSETLLLLAIKTYDYERHCVPALRDGYLVVEGRSVHTTAVYQSLILHPGDDASALAEAHAILDAAAHWRPLPDLMLLITDDVAAAIDRMERRDRRRCTPEQRQLHHRAAWLFTQLARAEPARIRVLDRRRTDRAAVVEAMAAAVGETPPRQQPPSASDAGHT